MSRTRGKILLCKARAQGESEDGEKSYSKVLESAGFSCTQLAVLRFEFVNLDELCSLLLTPDAHSGLILTSPRSAEAVGLALGDKGVDVERVSDDIWKKLPIYCVGSATDRVARDLLGLRNCRGSETGNAKDLAELIVGDARSGVHVSDGKPLLYPCSAVARDTLGSVVENAGIALRKLSVYQTLPSKTLETDLKNEICGDSAPEYLVFFSPSAVGHVTDTMKLNNQYKLLENIKFVAIGPVTEQAILDAGLKVYATSKHPEPLALSNAIQDKLNIS